MADRDYSAFDVNIHGKMYRTVAGRIKEFWDRVADGAIHDAAILTEVTVTGDVVLVKATARVGEYVATGHASEIIGSAGVNTDSALENAETSAVGRALGNMAIGLLGPGGVASADEVQGAERKRHSATSEPATPAQVNLLTMLSKKLKLTTAQSKAIRAELGIPLDGPVSKANASKYIEHLKALESSTPAQSKAEFDDPFPHDATEN